jgi:hypothetical protein
MLNFAEQTGSGAVMLVWSFPTSHYLHDNIFRLYVQQTTLPWYSPRLGPTYKNYLGTYLLSTVLYSTLLYLLLTN